LTELVGCVRARSRFLHPGPQRGIAVAGQRPHSFAGAADAARAMRPRKRHHVDDAWVRVSCRHTSSPGIVQRTAGPRSVPARRMSNAHVRRSRYWIRAPRSEVLDSFETAETCLAGRTLSIALTWRQRGSRRQLVAWICGSARLRIRARAPWTGGSSSLMAVSDPAQSWVTDTTRGSCIYSSVLHAAPVPLEQLEGALEAQRLVVAADADRFRQWSEASAMLVHVRSVKPRACSWERDRDIVEPDVVR